MDSTQLRNFATHQMAQMKNKACFPSFLPRGVLMLFVMLAIAGPVSGQYTQERQVSKHIHKLAADKMKGRGTGSKELDKAARYIQKHFKKFGLEPLGTEDYRQTFTARVRRVVVDDSIRQAHNIIGFLNNGADHTIVVGAHYDHLGMGTQGGSLNSLAHGKIHQGADDNASGVAGLLEMARHFAQNDETEPYNILFIAFSAEELGLLGSRHFVEEPTLPLQDLHFMLNFDMIGRYDQQLAVIGYGTSPSWPSIFDRVDSRGLRIHRGHDGSGGSDQTSFYRKDIPVLFFHTGGHPEYHRPGDTPDKINYPATVAIIDIAIDVVKSAMEESKLVFTPTH